MRKTRRLIAALCLAAMCAPGTFVRTPVSWDPPARIEIAHIQEASDTGTPGWSVAGVWHYSAQSLLFGGFSALIALPENRLVAFSDRSGRLSLTEPDAGTPAQSVTRQQPALGDPLAIIDIEAAAHDPQSGRYWLVMENNDAIHRFDADHTPQGILKLDARALGWSSNTGAEVMERLDDGRFIILPEGRRTGLIFATDPLEKGVYTQFAYLPPVPGHAATDMAQLPDGRVLLLLRNLDVVGGIPPFESKIAIGPPPKTGSKLAWTPQVTLDLAGVIPRDNYEGIAVREMADGRVAVWLISDDNMSVIQRTLVAKLILDPAALDD